MTVKSAGSVAPEASAGANAAAAAADDRQAKYKARADATAVVESRSIANATAFEEVNLVVEAAAAAQAAAKEATGLGAEKKQVQAPTAAALVTDTVSARHLANYNAAEEHNLADRATAKANAAVDAAAAEAHDAIADAETAVAIISVSPAPARAKAAEATQSPGVAASDADVGVLVGKHVVLIGVSDLKKKLEGRTGFLDRYDADKAVHATRLRSDGKEVASMLSQKICQEITAEEHADSVTVAAADHAATDESKFGNTKAAADTEAAAATAAASAHSLPLILPEEAQPKPSVLVRSSRKGANLQFDNPRTLSSLEATNTEFKDDLLVGRYVQFVELSAAKKKLNGRTGYTNRYDVAKGMYEVTLQSDGEPVTSMFLPNNLREVSDVTSKFIDHSHGDVRPALMDPCPHIDSDEFEQCSLFVRDRKFYHMCVSPADARPPFYDGRFPPPLTVLAAPVDWPDRPDRSD